MKKILAVLILSVSLLLPGSVATADKYSVIPEREGDIVQRDGNNVTDAYIEAVRECQIEVDLLREKVDESPGENVRDFTDGILWGSLGTVLLMLLL